MPCNARSRAAQALHDFSPRTYGPSRYSSAADVTKVYHWFWSSCATHTGVESLAVYSPHRDHTLSALPHIGSFRFFVLPHVRTAVFPARRHFKPRITRDRSITQPVKMSFNQILDLAAFDFFIFIYILAPGAMYR